MFEKYGGFLVIEGQSVDESRKRTFLVFLVIICYPFISLFTIDDLKNQRILEGFSLLLLLSVFVLNLIELKIAKYINDVYHISAAMTLLLLSIELAIGGGEGQAFFRLQKPLDFCQRN